jgi:iron complex outermembrane receptor protein
MRRHIRSMSYKPLVTVASVCAGACLAGSALAAEDAIITEVVVTAQKREQNLQDVSIAVSALSGEDMTKAGMTMIEDIHERVPNLNISTAKGESKLRLFIRGVGQNDALAIADPGVGMYVDGVYYTRVTNLSFALNDIERVEVLRGPQGTLFGKNTIGGAINVITRDPQSVPELELGVGVGSWDRQALNMKVNGPLIEDRVLGRLSAQFDRHDGWATNRYDGRKLMRSQEIAVSGGLKFLVTDEQDFTIKLAYSDTKSDGTILKAYTDILAGDDPLDFNRNLHGSAHHTSFSATATYVAELSDSLTLKSITHYRDYEYHEEAVDYDGSPLGLLDQYDQRAPFEQWGEELQLLGSSFDGKLEWVVGAYWQHDEGFSTEYDCIVRLAPGPCSRDTYAVVYDAFQVNQETDSYALFAQGTYALTDALGLTLGVRWSLDDKQGYHTLSTTSPSPEYFRYEGDWSEVTYKATLDYRINDNWMTYATVASGYKAGQLPGRAMSEEEVRAFMLDPEQVLSYEVGFKADLFERRVRLNAAAFHVDYTDLQIQTFATNPDGTLDFSQANAPESRIRGIEAELTAQLGPSLQIGASLGYLDAEYTSYRVGDEDRSHLELEHAPEYQYSVYGEYSYFMPGGARLIGRATYTHIDDQFYAQSNTPGVFQEGYGLASAKLSYLSANDKMEISVSGRNLTDEIYSSFAIDLFGGARAYGPKRHFLVDATYRF